MAMPPQIENLQIVSVTPIFVVDAHCKAPRRLQYVLISLDSSAGGLMHM
jgi:hypothetical protein